MVHLQAFKKNLNYKLKEKNEEAKKNKGVPEGVWARLTLGFEPH